MITKYNQFMNERLSPQRIRSKKALAEMGINTYTFRDDDKVDVPSSVYVDCNFHRIYGLEFGTVDGDFTVYKDTITTLYGCPEKVTGRFDCSEQKLTCLEGAPDYVGGDFNCSTNYLTNLSYGPSVVIGDYNCSSNNLSSLKGSPEQCRTFHCSENDLESLEGGPKFVTNGDYFCDSNHLDNLDGLAQGVHHTLHLDWNNLTSLKGCPEKLDGDLHIDHNQLETLEGCPRIIKGNLLANHNKLKNLKGGPKAIGGMNYFFADNPIVSLDGAAESFSKKTTPSFVGCPVEEILEHFMMDYKEAIKLLNEWEVIDEDDMTVSFSRICEVFEALDMPEPTQDEFKFKKYTLID